MGLIRGDFCTVILHGLGTVEDFHELVVPQYTPGLRLFPDNFVNKIFRSDGICGLIIAHSGRMHHSVDFLSGQKPSQLIQQILRGFNRDAFQQGRGYAGL